MEAGIKALLIIPLAFALSFGVGCAAKKPAKSARAVGPDVILDAVSCQIAEVVMHDCEDVSTSPPKNCRQISVKYKAGCEHIKLPTAEGR